jgi:alpha-D-ribose 1-methylphosphonate 5-triphosphate synthase subunit PhnG
MAESSTAETSAARAAWIGLLARADPALLAARMAALGEMPAHHWKRAPNTGLIMARGRAGGTGAAFNLGEMSATRATVALDDGTEGHAYVLGRDKDHARHAALCDALLQTDASARVRAEILEPLAEAEAARRLTQQRKAAATRVEFFTMTRGS